MADSPFIKLQDPENLGQVTACDEYMPLGANVCPDPALNPSYIGPDWKTKDEYKPWLNEKTGFYEITVVTNETKIVPEPNASAAVADEYLENMFLEYGSVALENLLDYFGKVSDAVTVENLRPLIIHRRYDIDPRPSSYVKLLYAIQREEIEAIIDSEEVFEDPGPVTHVYTFNTSELLINLRKVRQALHSFSRKMKIFQSVQGGSLVSNGEGSLFSLDRFGDSGLGGSGTLDRQFKDIDNFFSSEGFKLVNNPVPENSATSSTGGAPVIRDIEFGFTEHWSLKYIKIFLLDKPKEPILYGETKLKKLLKKDAFRDRTSLAYLARANEMVRDLTAREPMPWLQFIKKYTYPSISDRLGFPKNTQFLDDAKEMYGMASDFINKTDNAIVNSLREEMKPLGFDVLDEDFSLADSLLYAFNQSPCLQNMTDLREQQSRMNLVHDPKNADKSTMIALAREQSFKEFKIDGGSLLMMAQVLCEHQDEFSFSLESARDFSKKVLARLKMSGLKDMLNGAIECLMSRISLDNALPIIALAALKGMPLEDMGFLIDQLPSRDRGVIKRKVKALLDPGNWDTESMAADVRKYLESDVAPHTDLEPWQNEELVRESKASYYSSAGGLGQKAEALQDRIATDYGNVRRTLARSLDTQQARDDSASGFVMELWTREVVGFYAEEGRLLDLIEQLNGFPGVPLLTKALMLLNCPPAELLAGLRLDFMNDMELPLFQGIDDIAMPPLRNPLEWLPTWKDVTSIIPVVLKLALQKLMFSILSRLISKISGVLGGNSCLLGAADFEIDLATLDNGDQMFELIRDSLLDGQATMEEIANTTKDVFSKLGFGRKVFEDQERFMDFIYDMSSNLTRREMADMFTGEPTDESLSVIDQLIEHDYPEYRDALPTAAVIGEMTNNIGNLFPVEFRDSLKGFRDDLPEGDTIPANPSLCACPQDIEDFCNNRKRLLADRATPAQIEAMCEGLQQDLIDTLGDLVEAEPADMFTNALPPIQSDPGCDNGIIPFEPPAVSTAVNKSLELLLQQVDIEFTTDMLGNGPGEANWGFLNMVMSDTLGNPLSAHYRKASRARGNYVDFVKTLGDGRQEGQFPYKVAEWLQYSLGGLSASFSANNIYVDNSVTKKTFSALGVAIAYNAIEKYSDIDLPSFGYGTKPVIDFENNTIKFVKEGKKEVSDFRLEYTDNNGGRHGIQSPATEDTRYFSYGFNIDLFNQDVQADVEGNYTNRPYDNVRVKVTERNNLSAPISGPEFLSMNFFEKSEYIARMALNLRNSVQETVAYEFLAVDDFVKIDNLTQYPTFTTVLESTPGEYSPPTVLVYDMITQRNIKVRDFDSAVSTISWADAQDIQNNVYNKIFNTLALHISGNETPFLYGAQFDNLTREEINYVVKSGQTRSDAGTLYSDARVWDEELQQERSIVNEDGILGISYDQYQNELNGTPEDTRVFYLDPAQFGELYVRPAMYIKPMRSLGWMGIIDAIYPDFRTEESYDMIGFDEIAKAVGKTQNKIPLDERLRQNPDEAMELPYNRILERSSISGIQGVISATCRMFGAVHYLKTLATFMTFRPDFMKTYSSIYPQYIVETMEKSLKNTSSAVWDLVSPFSDEEFWYLFLEQCVQTYARLIDDETITSPPKSVLAALFRINDMQDEFEWLSKSEWRTTLEGRTAAATYPEYVMKEKIKAIKETEADAKIVCKEIVKMELNIVSERFLQSMQAGNGIKPTYSDIENYFMRTFVYGAQSLNSILDAETEASSDAETEGPLHGTTSVDFGHDHVYDVDASGNGWAYRAYHPERSEISHKHEVVGWAVMESQSNCYPDCEEEHGVRGVGPHIHHIGGTIKTIGDIDEYNIATLSSKAAEDLGSPSSYVFGIQKYMKINNVKYSPTDATAMVEQYYSQDLNISDVFPGTLKIIHNTISTAAGDTVGYGDIALEGELGIRHGLQFSLLYKGEVIELTTVEIDALDTKIDDLKFIEANSELLECLVRLLYNSEDYKLITKYIFPLNKMLSTLAVYNDLAFLPSIGEVTVETGKYTNDMSLLGDYSLGLTPLTFPVLPADKPGTIISFDSDYNVEYKYNEGWASIDDRNPGPFGGMFVREWDSWDQEVLRNTKSRIKRIFKSFYYSRDFDDKVERMLKTRPNRGATKSLKDNLSHKTYMQQLKKWEKRLQRPNPFDFKGDIIKKYQS